MEKLLIGADQNEMVAAGREISREIADLPTGELERRINAFVEILSRNGIERMSSEDLQELRKNQFVLPKKLQGLSVEQQQNILVQIFANKLLVVSMDLEENELTQLPASVGDWGHLRDLSIAKNRFREVPEAIFRLSNLIFLDMHGNQLSTIPPAIDRLSKLTNLTLRNNNIKTLPDEVGRLCNLVCLDLFENQLEVLPDTIGSLANLQFLNVASNRLECLPPSFGRLKRLVQVHLQSNQLHVIPKSVENTASLKYFILSNNRLQLRGDADSRGKIELQQVFGKKVIL